MKIEIKHLAPYLPYKLMAYTMFDRTPLFREIVPSNIMAFVDGDTEAKPILRPLSDLTKEIDVDGEKFVPMERIPREIGIEWCDLYSESMDCLENHPDKVLMMPYEIFQVLLKLHFDVFGLIPAGLAVDINEVQS